MISPVWRKLPVLLLAALSLAANGLTLEGRWRLVEQRHESGMTNLAGPEAPVHLEFRLEDTRLVGRVWAGKDASRALSWPAFLSEHGSSSVEVRDRVVGPGNDSARAVYRIKGSSVGEFVEVTEEYRVAEAGRALVGTVTVTAWSGGSSGGSYTLHRRFERIP